ncbi:MAG TPA: uracil-DNA glycosylase family protein [Acidimicrobiia bacterium]
MDRSTVDVYERRAREWEQARSAGALDLAAAFTSRVPAGEPRLDLACGPGWHASHLGQPVVATDAAVAMLELVPGHAPDALRVAHDLEAVPFRRGAFAGVWAHKCLMHIAKERVPLALADLHHASAVGAALHIRVTSDRATAEQQDEFGGRHFAFWNPDHLTRVVVGAGYRVDEVHDDGEEWLDIEATRLRTLPDTVGPGMRLLIVGLNPSPLSADKGIGFFRPGNRFWPAALASGIVTRDRDTRHALVEHAVGFSDLVKRATAGAKEIAVDEYRAGADRVRALVEWLQPPTVLFAGLDGYRKVIDRHAIAGWQDRDFAGSRCYVMPNPSGLNAHTNVADVAAHMRTAYGL